MVRQLVEHRDRTIPGADTLTRLRYARCSSAPLDEDLHRSFERRFGVPLVQAMGMTEAGLVFMNPPSMAERRIGALGMSHRVEVKVVDAGGREVAPTETGELLIRGPAVMLGYHDDPDATAAVLDRDGWLHTGDRVCRDPDGFFRHAGRIKDLVIKAGVNIAPREVEDALCSHPAIAEAVVVGVPDPFVGEDLAAFVVQRRGGGLQDRQLQHHCEQAVGAFKSPSELRFVDALPRLPNGKIDRVALVERATRDARTFADIVQPDQAGTRRPPEAPRTPTEAVVARLWREVLTVDVPSIHLDFFHLGGTSLHALDLSSRVRDELGVLLPLSGLFRATTVAEQAAVIEAAQSRGERPAIVQPPSDGATAVLLAPVSPDTQRRPLFCCFGVARYRRLAEALGPEQPVYAVYVGEELEQATGSHHRSGFLFDTVEALAERYLVAVREVQPAGPYRLAGFSFGGLVAFELAHQLAAAGERTELLLLLDTFMTGAIKRAWIPWFIHHVERLRADGAAHLIRFWDERRSRRQRRQDDLTAPDPVRARNGAFRATARRQYQPRPYPGNAVLVATSHSQADHYRVLPNNGWDPLVLGTLESHVIPGTHDAAISKTGAAFVAQHLRRHLSPTISPERG